ncbi:MAG: cysteine hydrolase family protein [Traorella sp.]
MKELLFVIDMVNGFVKEGSMHDQKIMSIVDVIQQECEQHEHRLFIADTHPSDAIEFKSFPAHCIKNTHEAEIIDELKPYVQDILEKNSTNAFHVLDKNIFNKYDSFKLVGCCSDICVMQFALSLKTYLNQMNMPKDVIVIEKGIATYDSPTHQADIYHQMAIQIMQQSGIVIQ